MGAVAVVKYSIVVGFKYCRRFIWYEKCSCHTSYDNFPSNVHTRELQPLRHDICYNDVIFSVANALRSKFVFAIKLVLWYGFTVYHSVFIISLLSPGIYCTPSYHRGKSVWTDMTSLYAGSPMIQCKVVVPTSSPSSLEETGDSLDGSTCKKPRTQFTPKQLIYLEDRFAENDLPTFKDREDMARELNLTQMHLQVRCLVPLYSCSRIFLNIPLS